METETRTILITGATSGLGKAAARWLASRGWQVAFCGRRADRGREIEQKIRAAGGKALFVQADVTQEQDVIRFLGDTLDHFGVPDAAFNNAGGNLAFGQLASLSREDFERTLAVNLTGLFLCLKHEIAAMRGTGGSIVNTASTAGVKGVAVGIAAYAAAKHGVIGLTRCAALEYASAGIRVNALVLGAVATDTWLEKVGRESGRIAAISAGIPLGKVGDPAEVMPLLEYLAAPASAFMTGAAIALDGGVTAG